MGASCVWKGAGSVLAGRLLGGSSWDKCERFLGGYWDIVWRPLRSPCEALWQVAGRMWEDLGSLLRGRGRGVCLECAWRFLGLLGSNLLLAVAVVAVAEVAQSVLQLLLPLLLSLSAVALLLQLPFLLLLPLLLWQRLQLLLCCC